MRAHLRYLHSPDLLDLEGSEPPKPDDFCLLVQALVGPIEGNVELMGEESFDFLVCSPTWLAKHLSGGSPLFGRHHLFLERYDYSVLRTSIERLCEQAKGKEWADVAGFLARFGHWEFEDYESV